MFTIDIPLPILSILNTKTTFLLEKLNPFTFKSQNPSYFSGFFITHEWHLCVTCGLTFARG